MSDGLRIAMHAAVTIVLIGFPVHMIALSVLAPRKLYEISMLVGQRPKRRYAYIICCVIGFAVFTYHGVHGMLDWLPTSWGGEDEYGEWVTVATSVASMAAFAGGFGFPALLHRSAEGRLIAEERPPKP